MAEGRDIDDTESLRIAELFLAIIIITLLFEKLTHFLDKNLKGRTRRGLRHAVHYIEEELLALGLISLLLIVAEVMPISSHPSNGLRNSSSKFAWIMKTINPKRRKKWTTTIDASTHENYSPVKNHLSHFLKVGRWRRIV